MNKCHAGHVAVSPAILCKLLPCMYIHQEDLIISLLNSNNARLSEGLATRCCRILKQLDGEPDLEMIGADAFVLVTSSLHTEFDSFKEEFKREDLVCSR